MKRGDRAVIAVYAEYGVTARDLRDLATIYRDEAAYGPHGRVKHARDGARCFERLAVLVDRTMPRRATLRR